MVIGILAEDKVQNAKRAAESMENVSVEVVTHNGKKCVRAFWFDFEGTEHQTWVMIDRSLSNEADCIEECKFRVRQEIEEYRKHVLWSAP